MTQESPLTRERQGSSFSVEALTHYLDGSEQKTKRKKQIREIVESDPIFKRDDVYFISRLENYKRVLQKHTHSIKLIKDLNLTPEEQMYWFDVVGHLGSPLSLHTSMFIPTLTSQASPEQLEEWGGKAYRYEIIGTYAQTELGHGSYVPGLETTATFDEATQEFVLNTPTITATKWWPGGLGKTSTHCVLLARLIIKDKDYGVHPFLLQLRSLEDHKSLPGITLGDIGPKFGFNTNDNGFLRLNNVRIPRTNMLMGFAKVSPTGEYTKPPHDKLTYGTMIFVRAGLVGHAGNNLSKAVTIAIRYSAVRRQGYLESQKRVGMEQKVLDFTMQQYRLFPILSAAYAIHFTGVYMKKLYVNLVNNMKGGDFSGLPETHATSAGLKAFASWIAGEGMEECRKCCGGHGYLQASGIPLLYADYIPACTYEGDNVVLIQQTARYLLKCFSTVQEGKSLQGNVRYLETALKKLKQRCAAKTNEDFVHPALQLEIYQHRAARLLTEVASSLASELKSGITFYEAWNAVMPDFYRMTRAHCYYIMLVSFTEAVDNAPREIHEILSLMRDLFAFYHIERDVADFVEDGYLNNDQVNIVKKNVRRLLSIIRRDAVALVDAFNFSDAMLNSALGRYDGDVYNSLMEWAKKEPLNKTDVVDGYEQFLKPLLKSKM
eukprot:TRINITY_DN6146_c0_g1_i1.p1 TRINITY_DN6146_c0_g1~~TRINITY_DN6146_c0_g1_i1.p1  ORF type:complete len:676 (+),score=120.30 TRINITY_DN6146_c0_g1_i1:43-2028(+)